MAGNQKLSLKSYLDTEKNANVARVFKKLFTPYVVIQEFNTCKYFLFSNQVPGSILQGYPSHMNAITI